MPKIEVPTSVTLYVQWTLLPFPNPRVSQHDSTNSKWAIAETKKLLKENSIDERDVKVAVQNNGKILIKIHHPEKQVEHGKELWEYVLSFLKKTNDIVSISIFVNNDISERIAINLSETVNHPWHKGYQGFNSTTLIYHK